MIYKRLRGTKTEQNLINAFAGESQARNRYTYFAKKAKEEGYEQIAEIFCMTADNEKEHAKLFYEYLGDIRGHVDAEYPFELGTTEENLESAAAGEKEEWSFLYADGEKTAREEGFDDVADTFHYVIEAEKHHEQRYLKLLENIKNDTVFSKEKETYWMCRECGYVHHGKSAPKKCPNCHHPQAYFQVLCENY
ncbi:rubrerythrin [Fusobacterium sp. CAG:439]|nr:rubrerythrin [Fusobacterium sp. CAG:439]HIT93136.1 rubrerythrin family protein [Candidatus Stercorousia faecigallinarum]